jgi:hypothetical protein
VGEAAPEWSQRDCGGAAQRAAQSGTSCSQWNLEQFNEQQCGEQRCAQRTLLHNAESGAVQQAAVLRAELRTADFEAVLRTEASGAAAKRTVLYGSVLQSAGGGKLGVEQAGQFEILDSFSLFFHKNISFFKKNSVHSVSTKKIYPSHCQPPPSQRPKKAQHAQDLKPP